MNHKDAAQLLAQVLPLITDGKPMNGPLGTAGKNAWRSLFNGEELSMEARSCEIVRDSTHVRAVANLATVFPIDLSTFAGQPRNAATTRAAVRLAVSRLYDGPQEAPAEVSSLPKVALCTERGCSQDRTVGLLCASHAGRAETYAREARAACVRREWDRHAELQEQMVRREPVGGGSINLAKACAGGARIDEALALARHSAPGVKFVPFSPVSIEAPTYVLRAPCLGHASEAAREDCQGQRGLNPMKVTISFTDPGPGTLKMQAGALGRMSDCKAPNTIVNGGGGGTIMVHGSDWSGEVDRIPCTSPGCKGHLDESAREHCLRRNGVGG